MTGKIVDKIKKLHEKAKGANDIGSLEEAKIFAKKVKELMDKHKIDMSQIEFTDYSKEDVESMVILWANCGHKNVQKAELWTRNLAVMVAQYCNCRVFSYKGTNRLIAYGRHTDLEVLEHMLKILTPLCLKLCKAAYHIIYWEVRPMHPDDRKATLKGFRASWKMGFIRGVQEGIQEAEAELKAKLEADHNTTALVRVSGMLEKIDDHIAEHVTFSKKKRSMSRYQYNQEGYDNGYDTGKSVGRDSNFG